MVKNNNQYRSLGKFWFKEKHYHMFANDYNQLAFLIIDDNGKYHYPTLKELVEVTLELKRKKEIKFIINDEKQSRKIKKFRFKPKIRKGLTTITLTAAVVSSIVGAVATSNTFQSNKQNTTIEHEYDNENDEKIIIVKTNDNTKENAITNNTIEININTEEKQEIDNKNNKIDEEKQVIDNENNVTDEEINSLLNEYQEKYTTSYDKVSITIDDEDILEGYEKLLASADETIDYKWANDYYETASHGTAFVRDANAYEYVYGYSKPTKEEIINAIQNNNNLDDHYKALFSTSTENLMNNNPDADLSILKHNVETINIIECDSRQMSHITGNSKTAACYIVTENTMYLQSGLDYNSLNYILEFNHEFRHVAKNDRFDKGQTRVIAKFYDSDFGGLYTDEALVTNFTIKDNNLDYKSTYYTLQCSYYRIILDCLGNRYTETDYLNHSINKLSTTMDDYMGDQRGYAAHMMSLMDAQAEFAYSNEIKSDEGNFQELYDYLIDMYCIKYLHEGMTSDEASQVFENFCNEIFYNFDKIQKYYSDLTPSVFDQEFKLNCQNLGIATSLTR